jgi:prophage antirepressor-like protein
MQNTTLMNFLGHDINIIEQEGKPLFAGMDACKMLDLRSGMAFRRLANDEKTYVSRTDLGMKPGKPLVFLTEGGFNSLISRSDKAEAVEFQRWVNHTVLPAIRKDGGYIMGEEKVATGELSEEEFIAKGYAMILAKAERLQKERDEAVVAKEKAEAKIQNVTLATWKGLRSLYLSAQDSSFIIKWAKLIGHERGLLPFPREVKNYRHDDGREFPREAVVYPIDILDEAAKQLDLKVAA